MTGSDEMKVQFIKFRSGFVRVWTHGQFVPSILGNPRGGIGVFFAEHHPANVSKRVYGLREHRLSDNYVRVRAIVEALQILLKKGHRMAEVRLDAAHVVKKAHAIQTGKWDDSQPLRGPWKQIKALASEMIVHYVHVPEKTEEGNFRAKILSYKAAVSRT